MIDNIDNNASSLEVLNQFFLLEYPKDAARKIESMLPKYSLAIFNHYNIDALIPVWQNLAPGTKESLLHKLPIELATKLLSSMDTNSCANLISGLTPSQQKKYLSLLEESDRRDVKEFMEYPEDSAGHLMDPKPIAFNEQITVGQVIQELKTKPTKSFHYLFTFNDDLQLTGQVDMQGIALANEDATLSSIATKVPVSCNMLDVRNDVVEKMQKFKINTLPILDPEERLIGIIHQSRVISALERSVAEDIQKMVGVSKEERALSPVLFKVQKRQPWLQINLVTAFLAAAVVGIFEGIIAEYTALAILLPVVAGQSGNTGAQALAVTMRGLTLREISTKQWLHIAIKELAAAFVNGILISITCSIAVYLWSKNIGLSLVIFLAMISSMVMAAVGGTLIPILLKKLGQDPALSSAIILSTLTDICGFMAFLGIATIFISLL